MINDHLSNLFQLITHWLG